MAFERLRDAVRGRLKRLRGAIGLGLTWAAGWAPVGAVVGLVIGTSGVVPAGIGLWSVVQGNTLTFAALGFVGGSLFSGVLTLIEGRRRFDQLSLPRFASWGAVGGITLGGLASALMMWGPGLVALKLGAAMLLGAASAAGSLTLARKANDRELLEAGEELVEVGLSEEERRHLLGRPDQIGRVPAGTDRP